MKVEPQDLKVGMVIAANPGTPDVREVTIQEGILEFYSDFFTVQTNQGEMQFRLRKVVLLEDENGNVKTNRSSVRLESD